MLGAMIATEECTVFFHAMADNANAAICAGRRQRMDCAFEAVIGMIDTIHRHLNGLVVIIAAGFAGRHRALLDVHDLSKVANLQRVPGPFGVAIDSVGDVINSCNVPLARLAFCGSDIDVNLLPVEGCSLHARFIRDLDERADAPHDEFDISAVFYGDAEFANEEP